MAEPETPRKRTRTAVAPLKAAVATNTLAAAKNGPVARKKPGPPKGSGGRPSKYSPEIAQQICLLLADGVPLREICRRDGFPAWSTIYEWMYRDDAAGERSVGLSEAIARAREVGQDAIAEQIWLDMQAEPERILSEGGGKIDPGYVQLIKARAEIGLKLLAKWNPKRYGDRVQLAGDAANPIKIEAETQADQMMSALLLNLELKRQDGSE